MTAGTPFRGAVAAEAARRFHDRVCGAAAMVPGVQLRCLLPAADAPPLVYLRTGAVPGPASSDHRLHLRQTIRLILQVMQRQSVVSRPVGKPRPLPPPVPPAWPASRTVALVLNRVPLGALQHLSATTATAVILAARPARRGSIPIASGSIASGPYRESLRTGNGRGWTVITLRRHDGFSVKSVSAALLLAFMGRAGGISRKSTGLRRPAALGGGAMGSGATPWPSKTGAGSSSAGRGGVSEPAERSGMVPVGARTDASGSQGFAFFLPGAVRHPERKWDEAWGFRSLAGIMPAGPVTAGDPGKRISFSPHHPRGGYPARGGRARFPLALRVREHRALLEAVSLDRTGANTGSDLFSLSDQRVKGAAFHKLVAVGGVSEALGATLWPSQARAHPSSAGTGVPGEPAERPGRVPGLRLPCLGMIAHAFGGQGFARAATKGALHLGRILGQDWERWQPASRMPALLAAQRTGGIGPAAVGGAAMDFGAALPSQQTEVSRSAAGTGGSRVGGQAGPDTFSRPAAIGGVMDLASKPRPPKAEARAHAPWMRLRASPGVPVQALPERTAETALVLGAGLSGYRPPGRSAPLVYRPAPRPTAAVADPQQQILRLKQHIQSTVVREIVQTRPWRSEMRDTLLSPVFLRSLTDQVCRAIDRRDGIDRYRRGL